MGDTHQAFGGGLAGAPPCLGAPTAAGGRPYIHTYTGHRPTAGGRMILQGPPCEKKPIFKKSPAPGFDKNYIKYGKSAGARAEPFTRPPNAPHAARAVLAPSAGGSWLCRNTRRGAAARLRRTIGHPEGGSSLSIPAYVCTYIHTYAPRLRGPPAVTKFRKVPAKTPRAEMHSSPRRLSGGFPQLL